ncbi:spore gernimation protein GerPD [Pseudalkalibacillus caeni]|uniref:Spore gernimation protein GerPD n=1 Tax=Exobacillus caeni TaxID=2574798 RepID=A0A5R9F2M6_9BACL|nr:spore gernimation protein GerPD [Pseudalkalibacillus caeni]TLS37922.1 spore gernimation protein GerPD [Pseudalkalibacillus caeni]
MNYQVINRGLNVGDVRIIAIASSAIFLVGDANNISCSSIYDTPPESYIVTRPFVPFAPSD